MPISAVLKAKELGTDLPNRSLSSAKARLPDSITKGAASAPPITLRREILRIKILPDGAASAWRIFECSGQREGPQD